LIITYRQEGSLMDIRLDDVYEALLMARGSLEDTLAYEADYADRQGDLQDVDTLLAMAEEVVLQLRELERLRGPHGSHSADAAAEVYRHRSVNRLITPHRRVVVSDDYIHAMGLTQVGAYDIGEIHETYWDFPTGADGEDPHEKACPICNPPKFDDNDIPF